MTPPEERITPEQLERVRKVERTLRRYSRPSVGYAAPVTDDSGLKENAANADAIAALLATVEQERERADENENNAGWLTVRAQQAEARHRDAQTLARAYKEAAEQAEAREREQREALERIADPETRWGRDVRNPVTHMRREARATLASTPNPEEVDQWSIGTGPSL